MADKAKIFTLFFILLMIISLGLAGTFFYSLRNEYAKNLSLQEQLSDVKEKYKIAGLKFEESRKTISALEAKLKENEAQVDSLNKLLQQEKTEKEEALSGTQQLRADLEQQKTLRSDLENKLAQAQKDLKKMQAQLSELESKKAELETKIKELEEKTKSVELGKIVVTPEQAAPPSAQAGASLETTKQEKKSNISELEGKVLVVNKEYNFIVINLGSKDGVKADNEFSVYHDNKYLGDVKVEKVHDSMASAGFVSQDIKEQVNEGDKVVRKNK